MPRFDRISTLGRMATACIALLVLLSQWSGCSARVSPETYTKFEAAQKTFDEAQSKEDFLRAASMYQEILDSGTKSGAVLYNQGNAFMRAGEKGRAIASYRQAQRYRPRDAYLTANLSFALGNSQPGRRKPIIEYVLFWSDWISYPIKLRSTLVLAVLAFGIATAGLFLRRSILSRVAFGVLLLTLAGVSSSLYDWYRFDHLKSGVVVQADVVARKGNSESYEPAFTQPLSETTEFQLVERRGDWLLIRLAADQEGWIPSRDAVVY